MDLIETRQALAAALGAHDAEAVKSLLHPSFIAINKDGDVFMDYGGMVDQLDDFFTEHPEYRQLVRTEVISVDGDSARLTTYRTESLKGIWLSRSNVVSRWEETWRRVNEKWVIVAEMSSSPQHHA